MQRLTKRWTGLGRANEPLLDARPSEAYRILVVDDNSDLLNMLTSYLSLKGYRVSNARSAEEAIQHLGQWNPHVLLTDVRMPGGGARLLLEYLQRLCTPPSVLLMTGSDFEWAMRMVSEGLAAGLLRKPFLMVELVAAIEQIQGLHDH